MLDPEGTASTKEAKTQVLFNFLFDLSQRVCGGAIPNRPEKPFASETLLSRVEQALIRYDRRSTRRSITHAIGPSELPNLLRFMSSRAISLPFVDRASDIVLRVIALPSKMDGWAEVLHETLGPALSLHQLNPDSVAANSAIIIALSREMNHPLLHQFDVSWDRVWTTSLQEEILNKLFEIANDELRWHENDFDADLFYVGDILKRIVSGRLVGKRAGKIKQSANELLDKIYGRYPQFAAHEPSDEMMPDLDSLVEDIREAVGVPAEDSFDDDVDADDLLF